MNPTAVGDPVDAILLREVAALSPRAERVVVLDDATGALSLSLQDLDRAGPLRVHSDLLSDEQRVRAVAVAAAGRLVWHFELSEGLLRDATLVVLRLPKSLAALDEIAEAVACFADPGVRLLAGGRAKHMTPGMNRVLLRHFGQVSASLGRQKSRVLRAAQPHPYPHPHPHPHADGVAQLSYPRCERHNDLGLTVCAHGAAFAGTSIDAGTRLLASVLSQLPTSAGTVVDLGCGTGVLATVAARQLPEARVLAVDESAAACRSASTTAERNGCGQRVRVEREDLLAGVPDHSVDAVVCNPPFHRGTARDSAVAFRMFAAAGRVLGPSGELWVVYNSHLPYLVALRRSVGQTAIVVQNPRFTVTRSRVPAHSLQQQPPGVRPW